MDILTQIKKVPDLAHVPDEQLQWLIDQSEQLTLPAGGFIFKKGEPIDNLVVILTGHFAVKVERNGQFQLIAEIESPAVTGLLPYSRATHASGYGEATEESELLILERSHFKHMITHHDELTAGLVHIMSSRIRDFTRFEQQNDKMIALGKLSAGLAHELNNPSAAVVRSAQVLSKHLKNVPDKFKSVIKIKATDESVDKVNEVLFEKIGEGIQHLSMLEKADREDELLDWLEDNDIRDADEIVHNFVDYGFEEDDLEEIKEELREEDLGPVVHWLNQMMTTARLVTEIEEASRRINELVQSVKSYTHMDQAPEKQFSNLHKGIENTLTMLNHKLKKGNIEVVKEFDENMESVCILVGQMNQVWTNIIDNAIDAMKESEKSELHIRTKQNGKYANIYIKDSGSGIPEEMIDKIFDPFFTTKAIGEGTGIGLELVKEIITKRHNGIIEVDSEPGNTVFHICLPVAG